MSTKSYIKQRISAVLLIPLSLCFVWSICQFLHQGADYFTNFMRSGVNIIWLSMFVLIALYHAIFGLDAIISDYITSKTSRYIIWIVLLSIYSTTIFAFIFAMFRFNSFI